MHLFPENCVIGGQAVCGHPWLGSYMYQESVSAALRLPKHSNPPVSL